MLRLLREYRGDTRVELEVHTNGSKVRLLMPDDLTVDLSGGIEDALQPLANLRGVRVAS